MMAAMRVREGRLEVTAREKRMAVAFLAPARVTGTVVAGLTALLGVRSYLIALFVAVAALAPLYPHRPWAPEAPDEYTSDRQP